MCNQLILKGIADKQYRECVKGLVSEYALTMKRTRRGIRLYTSDGRYVGMAHVSPSDKRAWMELRTDVTNRLRDMGVGPVPAA